MVSRTSLVAVAIAAAMLPGPAAAVDLPPVCGEGAAVQRHYLGACATNTENLKELSPSITASSMTECYGEAEVWAALTGNFGTGVIAEYNNRSNECKVLYTQAGTANEDWASVSCTYTNPMPFNQYRSCFLPAPTGSVAGDPHFVGFNHAKYDYHGKPGAVFNVLSTKDTQVNALLGPDLINGLTYMSAIGVSTNGSRIKVGINESRMQVLVDDIEVTTAVPVELATGSVVATEDAVTITSSDVVMVFTTHNGQFIDIDSVALLRPMADIHGVLGQTAAPSATESTTYTGEDADYFVTDLWASDFVHNLYSDDSAGVPAQRKVVDLSAHVVAQGSQQLPTAAVLNRNEEA